VCDTYPGIEVASRHALDEYELRPEDVATLAAISDLRDTYLRCVAIPGRADEDAYLLADIDQRLSSLEGRIAILRLATA
jgi:hypothetical protein